MWPWTRGRLDATLLRIRTAAMGRHVPRRAGVGPVALSAAFAGSRRSRGFGLCSFAGGAQPNWAHLFRLFLSEFLCYVLVDLSFNIFRYLKFIQTTTDFGSTKNSSFLCPQIFPFPAAATCSTLPPPALPLLHRRIVTRTSRCHPRAGEEDVFSPFNISNSTICASNFNILIVKY